MTSRTADTSTREALAKLAFVAATLLASSALTYFVPGLSRYRPWTVGDPWPLSSLFSHWSGSTDVPQVAGAVGAYQAPSDNAEALEKQLGSSIASNLGAPPSPRSAGGSPDAASQSRGPQNRIDPGEYANIDVTIEDPGGRGMGPFYRALEKTLRKEPKALTRVGHYGDSSIATDLITSTVRERLQVRFGDGGHGFVLIARGYMPYRHRNVTHRANDGWSLREIVRKQDAKGWYGYGGVQYQSRSGAFATFGTDDSGPIGGRVGSFELYYQGYPGGGSVRLDVDGKERQTVDTRSAQMQDGFARIDVTDGAHAMDVRASGNSRLYGVVLERQGPGVVYDSLGLVGARARRLLHFDAAHIEGQIAHRGLNLLVLGFGGNEAGDQVERVETYAADFRRVIRHMRGSRTDMGCLVFAPLDQAEREESGKIATMRSVPVIVRAQREAALAEGCAFYNTYQAMGGEGSMQRWYRSRPRLAMGDFRHATPAGYEVIGNMFYKALLQGFAHHLGDRLHPSK